MLTLDTDLIHSRAHLSKSARELKTKSSACSAFVWLQKKKKRQLRGLHKLFDAGSCFQPNSLQTASKAKGTAKRATRTYNLFADAREIDVVSWL